jgi:hypothetical protein
MAVPQVRAYLHGITLFPISCAIAHAGSVWKDSNRAVTMHSLQQSTPLACFLAAEADSHFNLNPEGI